MLSSMTGYGLVSEVVQCGRGKLEISIEVRTVNSKFLDINVRSPRPYVVFDSQMGKLIRQYLKRGRVDVGVSVEVLEGRERDIYVNHTQAQAVFDGLDKVRKSLKIESPITVSDLLTQSDWLQKHDVDINEQEEWGFIESIFKKTLAAVVKSRLSEGESLRASIQNHRKLFEASFEKIRSRHSEMLVMVRQKAKDRLEQLFQGQNFDPNRLEQELVMWVSRSDFHEEIDRIVHHLQTFDEVMSAGVEIGRKLEFVLQELHREVNTLGTKCPDAAALPLIVDLKSCLERMREQIQNVE